MAQLPVRSLQALGAYAHDLLEGIELAPYDALVLPLAGQCARALHDFDGVGGFFEYQELVCMPEAGNNLGPVIIRMRRADDDLHTGVDRPDFLYRLEAVPAGRHAHVNKCHRVGTSRFERRAYAFEAILALHRRIDIKRWPCYDRAALAEDRQLRSHKRRRAIFRVHKNLAEVVVNRAVVVDHENTLVSDFRLSSHAAPPAGSRAI